MRHLAFAGAALVSVVLASGCAVVHVAQLAAMGGSRSLRERLQGAAPNSPARPGLLILALDGVDRPLLYGMLRQGELPAMAELLGGDGGGGFPHAHFDDSMLRRCRRPPSPPG